MNKITNVRGFIHHLSLSFVIRKAMMWYVLIGLSLSLSGVAGLQFFYMIYLEKINREQKKRLYELERHTKYLSKRVNEAERQITEQNDLLETFFEETEEEEIWADVIEDR